MYDQARHATVKKRTRCLTICVNVHCAIMGAEDIVEHLVLEHHAAPGVENERGLLVELTHCFAACDMGPNVEIDGTFYDGVTPERLDEILASLD
jgi:NADH-quinone oxidoreductase subunit E